jgi:hypothetical protein
VTERVEKKIVDFWQTFVSVLRNTPDDQQKWVAPLARGA